MKKILFFAVLAVALVGFGMHSGIAQAQTANTAALQQQLDVAKATLVNLEMQQGMVPQGDDQLSNNATPAAAQTQTTSGLSVSQISAFEDTLTTLAGTLSQLNASLNANPTMTADQTAAVVTALSGMKSTLVAMAATINASEVTSPIAMAAPATPAAPSTVGAAANASAAAPAQVAQATPAQTPATTATTTATNTKATASTVQATAQASSIWSFAKSHWPAIVIILLVIAILAILFWPENTSEETTTSSVSAAVASAPANAPAQPVMTAAPDTTKVA